MRGVGLVAVENGDGKNKISVWDIVAYFILQKRSDQSTLLTRQGANKLPSLVSDIKWNLFPGFLEKAYLPKTINR